MKTPQIFLTLWHKLPPHWQDILTRAAWTFAQATGAFYLLLYSTGKLHSIGDVKTFLGGALAAGISALKTYWKSLKLRKMPAPTDPSNDLTPPVVDPAPTTPEPISPDPVAADPVAGVVDAVAEVAPTPAGRTDIPADGVDGA